MKITKLLLAAIVILLLISALPSGSASLTIDMSLPDVTMDEDMDALGEFNLHDYFSDDNSRIDFSSISGDNKIEVAIHGDGAVDFSAPKDWYGTEEVTFIASEGEQEISDTILVTVTPVNDPPLILMPIPDLPAFEEDTTLTDAINLNAHFQDVDNALTFSYSSEFIRVHIDDDGYVDIFAPDDWHGTEEVTFSASDGESDISDEVFIEVAPVNDAPKCAVNVLSISLKRDESPKILELEDYFTDVDDNSLTFELSGNHRINYEINTQKGQLILYAPQDWSGEEFITLKAKDLSGETSSMQIVVIASGNMDSSGQMFYLFGLVLALAISGVRLQMVGRKRSVKSPVKLGSYRFYKR